LELFTLPSKSDFLRDRHLFVITKEYRTKQKKATANQATGINLLFFDQ